MKEQILLTVDDLVADFLYYDRKEDEELGMHVIEEAVRTGEITVDEIVDRFEANLLKKLV